MSWLIQWSNRLATMHPRFDAMCGWRIPFLFSSLGCIYYYYYFFSCNPVHLLTSSHKQDQNSDHSSNAYAG